MVKVTNLRKEYPTGQGEVKAINGISFEVSSGEFFTLLGPSGCGKSTTLRCIAGLERPTDGEILIGDRVVFSARADRFVPPHKREIGMVFQSYAIWPHMTVYGNVSYPLKGKMPRAQIRRKVLEVLEMMQIQELIDRPAPLLSGGQQQRVAVARALVGGAKVLLLDEPLSNLDAKLRVHMRTELHELHRRVGITIIFVTHDQEEALSLSTKIAVMNEGRLVEVGEPIEIYRHPQTKFTAEFVGACNLVPGKIISRSKGTGTVQTVLGKVQCRILPDMPNGVVVSIRPEHIELKGRNDLLSEGGNVCKGTVVSRLFLGKLGECYVRVGTQDLKVQLPSFTDVQEGEEVCLYMPPEFCTAMGDE